MQLTYFAVLVLYLGLMLGIGAWFYRRNRNVSDYVLGARKLGPLVSALSAQASDMSGWLLMGLPGMAYLLWGGTAEAVWTAVGLWLGTWLNWLFAAERLRRFTGRLDALTFPDYFAKRFDDKSGVLRAVSAFFILFFFLIYTASMFSAGAKLFHTIFGVSYHAALLIGCAIIVSYTFLGGFLAVCWTDVIQGTLMFLALCVTPFFALRSIGGNVFDTLSRAGGDFSLWPAGPGKLPFLFVVSALAWGLGYFGQPHILPRFMAIRDPKEIPTARRVAMVWVTLSMTAAVVCGILGALLFPALADPETVFIHLSRDLFPPLISGILMTAILSAIMSTADSQLLVASSAAASDLWRGTFKPNASERSTLRISRITVIAVSVLAAALVYAENPDPATFLGQLNSSVFKLVAFAWAGFGAAFGPVILLSLYWKRLTRAGAAAGILAGGLTASVWRFCSGGVFALFDVYELLPGFIVSLLVIVVVSLCRKPNPELESIFDRCAEKE